MFRISQCIDNFQYYSFQECYATRRPSKLILVILCGFVKTQWCSFVFLKKVPTASNTNARCQKLRKHSNVFSIWNYLSLYSDCWSIQLKRKFRAFADTVALIIKFLCYTIFQAGLTYRTWYATEFFHVYNFFSIIAAYIKLDSKNTFKETRWVQILWKSTNLYSLFSFSNKNLCFWLEKQRIFL